MKKKRLRLALGVLATTLVAVGIVPLAAPLPALADTSQGVTVTATPNWGVSGSPSDFTLVHVTDYQVDASWTKGAAAAPAPVGTDHTVVNTLMRVEWGDTPADRTEGYEVYYGEASSFSDTTIDLTSLTSTPVYRIWTETVYYNVGGEIISNVWDEVGVFEEANFMSISWLFAVLALIPILLLCAMFIMRQMLLGFPAAIFWAIFGGYSYTLSESTWDIHYLVFFASLGMTIFCLIAMYSLRDKDLEGPDADAELFFDEKKEPDLRGNVEVTNPDDGQASDRVRALRARARKRRSSWGEGT